ncbi:MAG: YHYH protein [Cyclobacteriaceae bacterium]
MRKFNFLTVLAAFVFVSSSCSEDDSATSTDEDFTASISAGNTTVSESNGMSGFSISLNTSNNSGSGLAVSYSVSGTADAGTDYTSLDGSATIADGSQEVMVNVVVTDDTEEETDETIIITLVASEGVMVGSNGSITLTITDDDASTGGSTCSNDNSLNMTNTACTETPSVSNSYAETVSGDVRQIVTNRVPDHTYGNQVANLGITGLTSTTETFNLDASPSLAASVTNIVDSDFKPAYDFGIALNGVPIDPAPGEPFIFEDANTGEYNWDWVFEPTNNRTAVGLDCNTAHLQPDQMAGTGLIHYHGDMYEYADDLLPGLGSGTTTPTAAVQIGWASDGYPVVYKYGPDATGTFGLLSPSYVLKSGERPGDGESEPCGEYNGKYTNDYEYSQGAGDLDECNGIAQSITLGSETFDYFYVITEDFPVISRCISGTPGNDFKKGM